MTKENELEHNIDDVPINVLDEKNFNDFISKGFHFVKFYAPWCGAFFFVFFKLFKTQKLIVILNKIGHCKKLAPTWHELGVKYMRTGKVKISQLDCTQNAIICQDQGVRGYPTLIFFHNGKLVAKNFNLILLIISEDFC